MLNSRLRFSQKGFTLIELMVTVAIIGILMAAGIVAFTNAQRNARDARRKADIDAISKAFEQHYDNNNQVYATATSQLAAYFPAGAVPVDPQGGAYDVTFGSGNWCACATLEGDARGNATTDGSAGAGTCSYGTGATADFFCSSRRQ